MNAGQLFLTLGVISLLLVGCGSENPDLPVSKKTYASNIWTPAPCSSGGGNFKTVEISTDFFQAKNITFKSQYAHWIARPWRMLFSQNVKHVSIKFNRFAVEKTYDFLKLYHNNGTTDFTGISGEAGAPILNGEIGPYEVKGASNATGYLEFFFSTDQSNIYGGQVDTTRYTGYKIDGINLLCHSTYPCSSGTCPAGKVCSGGECIPTPINNMWISRNYPHDGYLLGTDDVIYVKTTQPAGYEMGLVLYPLNSNADFDIIASKTYPIPDYSSGKYDWESRRTAGKGEMIVIPKWGNLGDGERWIYIAIGSYGGSGSHDGSGQFRFYANVHSTNSDVAPYNYYTWYQGCARTDFATNPTEKNIVRRHLQNMSRAIYFATEGRHLLSEWTIKWQYLHDYCIWPTVTFSKTFEEQSICKGADTDHPCGDGWGYRIDWRTSAWCNCTPPQPCTCIDSQANSEKQGSDPGLHEYGHCVYGIADEYKGDDNCGHSIMNEGYWASLTDFCTQRNGGYDPDPPDSWTHSNSENNWSCLENRMPAWVSFPHGWTPDAFYRTASSPFLNEDHDLFGPIVQHCDPNCS
jgi:hypothetical protein